MTSAINRNPLVSIVTPLFNCESYIAETIKSVMNQSYNNWELIVIDDCSSDDGAMIVEKFCAHDARIRLIKSSVRLGNPAKPRNIGLKNANGKYLAFLDADDLWLRDKLQKQVAYLESHPEVFLLYSRFLVWQNGKVLENNIMPSRRKMKSGSIFDSLFLADNFIGCLTVMMRNNGERALFFDEDRELAAIEDYDLWLRISQTEKIDFIDEPLAIYRVHRNGISLDTLGLIRRYLYFLNKWRKNTGPRLMAPKYLFSFVYVCKLFGKSFLNKYREFSLKS